MAKGHWGHKGRKGKRGGSLPSRGRGGGRPGQMGGSLPRGTTSQVVSLINQGNIAQAGKTLGIPLRQDTPKASALHTIGRKLGKEVAITKIGRELKKGDSALVVKGSDRKPTTVEGFIGKVTKAEQFWPKGEQMPGYHLGVGKLNIDIIPGKSGVGHTIYKLKS